LKAVTLVLFKITYCRDVKFILFGGHSEKAAFSTKTDRFIWRYWVHCARCTLQDNERRDIEKPQRLFRQVPLRKV